MAMHYLSVVGGIMCQCDLYTQMRWVYFVRLHVPLKIQLFAMDSQKINRQSSRWAEITLDNDDNERIGENKESGQRSKVGMG